MKQIEEVDFMSEKQRVTYIKSKIAKFAARGNALKGKKGVTENKIFDRITQIRDQNRAVMRHIIFSEVLKIDEKFLGGEGSHHFFKRMKQWFYDGFRHRYNLSYTRYDGSGQKLPKDAQENKLAINNCVN
uniref:Uncharacterized protein n=1 Tax=Odontella aurita TaxID=265563 RepID=A0A7S4K8B3_9STRA|mmetsp:Transcript_6671/g.19775  ORF Transcript_6671/g.19775 Transcript_6671/m.19775 type:complete len:130 (+) Transcript_6671:460-849(+)